MFFSESPRLILLSTHTIVMFFTKSFATLVVFATAAVARISTSAGAGAVARLSNSAIGQDDTSSQPAFTSCSTVVSSVPDLSGNVQNATEDFQLAEVNLLKNEYPQSFADEVFELITYAIQPNGDGTGTTTTVFIIGEVTNANLTSFVQSWDGLTANGTTAVWTIEDVTCTAARVTCNLVMSPTPAVTNITDASNDILNGEDMLSFISSDLRSVFGEVANCDCYILAEILQIANQFPFETGILFDNDAIVGNADGSYNVTSSLQVGNITSDELIPFANSWAGKTISGEEAQWFVEVGSCVEQQD
ncbi:hypothetical protein GYMLUDRAFT_265222 [Collybiopsis luxurians FD-317 M1]|uniref:Uncharacterized protein n=1 Tax=Collybiopsis luxurians FD-317 M1 TaxID=944289 RepID=A0A0D0ARH7_9AGAR|nr:hypothetical protein GYMLUDRAFT_265222 [Collybiopsis luxurians FD-317 M1]